MAALGCAALLFLLGTPGCDRESPAGLEHHLKPMSELVSHTGCKEFEGLGASATAAAAQDCFEYAYAGGDTLLLTHVNAVFNCCPGEITADITIANDTITIAEHELEGLCHCLCLYDLKYRLTGIEAGTVTILFIEPYKPADDAPLEGTLDLSSSPSGSVCVPRIGYPWNTGGSTDPYGMLVSRTDCHTDANDAAYGTPTDLSCIEWRYLGGGALSMKHINAAFNCCPGEITAEISIVNDTITIVEHESQSLCDCNCLYDLDFEFWNLEPQSYFIRFVEPYVEPGDERLEFSIDLAEFPAGMRCAYRDHYPWGYLSSVPEDQAVLKSMADDIVELIGTPSCGGSGECRYIGVGAKPCGGFSGYLVYSTATTDVVELKYSVSRYNAFNKGFNRRYHIASDCMIVLPPEIGCVEGLCTDLSAKQ